MPPFLGRAIPEGSLALSLTAEMPSEAYPYQARPGPALISFALHAALIVALAYFMIVRPVSPPPVRSVDVQIISERAFEASATPAPPVLATQSPQIANLAPAPSTPRVVPAEPSKPSAPSSPLHDQLTTATTLFSSSLLKEVASNEVRRTLPTLAPYERMTQLCNIEATEQIKRALPASNPEAVSASAFGETALKAGILTADGAAFRSHRKWFFMRYACAVRSDFTGVVSFRFALGAPIPKDQWDSHDLIAIDEDDE
jgi:hypothetical protein